MKKLTLYTISELVPPLLAGIMFFTFIFVIQLLPELFKLIIQNNVPVFQALEIFVYLLPFNIAFIFPMSVLMGTIMGFGRLSGDNEIIAMRAVGFSHLRIYKPVFILGLMAFVFAFLFNNFVMTESNYRYRALINYMINISPSIAVSEYQFSTIPDIEISITAEKITASNMYNVIIYDGESGENTKIITAKTGMWKNNVVNSRLVTLELQDGIVQELFGDGTFSNDFNIFDKLDINILRDTQIKIGGHERGLREQSIFAIAKTIQENRIIAKKEISQTVSNMTLDAYSLESNIIVSNYMENTSDNEDIKTAPKLTIEKFSANYLKKNKSEIKMIKKDILNQYITKRYYIEITKYISIPAACIFMVLIGAPLGIIGKRGGRGLGFGISVLIVVVYYFVITGAEILGQGDSVHPLLVMWLPNILLFIVGSFLIIKSFFSRGK